LFYFCGAVFLEVLVTDDVTKTSVMQIESANVGGILVQANAPIYIIGLLTRSQIN
jgi:hypothetical protein